MSHYEVAIIGGGPAGLAAALALGRACRRVLLFDDGPPRNVAASHIHNFVTRDGTPPSEFRRLGCEQLAQYESVEMRTEEVISVSGERGAFTLRSPSGSVTARRIILCTGMVDEMLDIPGFRDAWGHSIYQCPYCHGWEVRGRRWGYLALDEEPLRFGFAALLTSWTNDVVVFRGGTDLSADAVEAAGRPGIRFEARPVIGLVVEGRLLTHVTLSDGEQVPCEVLYAHPPQRQVGLVQSLGIELDAQGFVSVDPMTRQTSIPGIYAAGDLTTRAQGAAFAAAAGTQAGAMANHDIALTGA